MGGQGRPGASYSPDASSYAAWGLFGFLAPGLAYSFFIGTIASGILWNAFVGFMYVRAIIATIDYRDLTDAINARAAEDTLLGHEDAT